MNIKVTTLSEEGEKDFDYRSFLQIDIDGKVMFRFLDGEPEDANLGRDFNDVYYITKAIKLAHRAGLHGEDLDIVSIEVDDLE